MILINSLAPGRFEWNLRLVIFKLNLVIDGWGFSCEIVLSWMSPDLIDDKSTSPAQVMAWCHQATIQGSHRSGKSQEKGKILKSQEKLRKFWYGSGNFEIHEKGQEKWSWYQYEPCTSNFDSHCHDVAAQSCNCHQEMLENLEAYFYNIWTFCKSSHNLVGKAHQNDILYLSFAKWSPQWIGAKVKM